MLHLFQNTLLTWQEYCGLDDQSNLLHWLKIKYYAVSVSENFSDRFVADMFKNKETTKECSEHEYVLNQQSNQLQVHTTDYFLEAL